LQLQGHLQQQKKSTGDIKRIFPSLLSGRILL